MPKRVRSPITHTTEKRRGAVVRVYRLPHERPVRERGMPIAQLEKDREEPVERLPEEDDFEEGD